MITDTDNKFLKYPIAEDASDIAISGESIPRSLITNININTSDVNKLYLKQIIRTPKLLTILIGTQDTDKLISTILIDDIDDNIIEFTSLTVDCTGFIIIGDIPDYTFNYKMDNAFISTKCITYSKAPGIKSISIKDKEGKIDSGFVEFKGDNIIFFEQDITDPNQVNVGLYDTVKADFLGKCDWPAQCKDRLVRQLGDIHPDTGSHTIKIIAVDEFSN